MNLVLVLSTVATVLSVGGNVLLAMRKKITFPIWIISNILWIGIIAKTSMNIPQLSMYAIYIGTSLMSWVNWSRCERKEK